MELSVSTKTKERRSGYRVSPAGLMLVIHGKNKAYPIKIKDISVSGVAISTNAAALKVGIVFKCDLAQEETTVLSDLKVRVVRRAQNLVAGVFLKKDDDQERVLGQIILAEQKRLKAEKQKAQDTASKASQGKPIRLDDPWSK
ncbi:PilZ domain-containing protein [Desulfovibrio inopinatus]|uniref:PilZ domain-containing protein n=1 Tax=Desulfovibrio inopinatus TaxID=102109 RepID=UPI0003FB33B8|nr:PilZ domain-containing protein [Desulfovibrio inopinatus]